MLLPLLTAAAGLLALLVLLQFALLRRARRENTDLRAECISLRESQRRFQAVMDNAPFEIVLKDAAGRYMQVNKAWERLYGLKTEEVLGKPVEEVLPASFSVALAHNDEEVLKQRAPSESEDRVVHVNGAVRDFLTIRFPISGSEGEPAGLGLIAADITDRKRAESALRETAEQLRTITDNLPVLIVRWDRVMRYSFANKPAQQWYGRPASEIVGRTIPEVFGQEAYEKVRWAIEKGLSGEPVRFEQRLRYPDGILRDVEIAYIPDVAENGLVLGCFALVQDISERESAIRALRTSEEQLRTVTDNLPVFISYVDETRRLRFVNSTAEKWFAAPANRILGRPVSDFFDPEEFAILKSYMDRASRGEDVHFETPLHYPDGIMRTVEVTYAPELREEGTAAGWFALVQDVTNRKRLEAELLRKERLAAMGQLTGTVAHELRNPLGAISMSLGVIRKKTASAGLDLERALDRSARAMRRCETIITELLDFARARGLQPVRTVIDDWLAELLDEYEMPEFVTVAWNPGCKGLEAKVDRDGLRRAVLNVLDNAREAMLEVQSEAGNGEYRLSVTTRLENDCLQMIFADTGPGISAETLDAVMEPLFSTKTFGTGLGLPTVKRIVEEHGGGIEVESEHGAGTSILLWLPRTP